jgi:hypothetical protein
MPLNGAQKNIVEGYLRNNLLDELAENLIPAMAIRALQVIMDGQVTAAERAEFTREDMWESIVIVRNKIIRHACPQNRNVGDKIAAIIALRMNPLLIPALMISGNPQSVEDGIIGNQVFIVVDNKIDMETQGVLGLTSRNSIGATITKADVVNYVNELFEAEVIKLRAMSVADNANSRISPDVRINRNNWALSITQEPRDKHYYLYIEGIGKNRVPFMKRYGKVKLNNRMDIDARSLTANDLVDRQHQTFEITHLAGNTLLNKIKGEILTLQARTAGSCDSCATFFTRKTNASQEWIRLMLREIDLDLQVNFTPSRIANNNGYQRVSSN